MISLETFEQIARKEQTSVFPNIVREYAQHLFLTELYQLPGSEKILFKGGTALHIVYHSPRFSEDLDFSLFNVSDNEIKRYVEHLFLSVLSKMEATGVRLEIGAKSDSTAGGYFGTATFRADGFTPINIEINVSARSRQGVQGEVETIANNFVPTYTIYHLPQTELVDEKIFGALLERKKPRDYYDLYFILRAGMLSVGQKQRLKKLATEIIHGVKRVDFHGELGVFLPANQKAIIRDFSETLEREMNNQLSLH